MNRNALLVLLSLILLAGCARKASDEIDFGVVQNNTYCNQYFGMKIPLPPAWAVQDAETLQRLMDQGKKMVVGDDKQLKAAVKAAEMQSINLMSVFKYPLGSAVSYNPNVTCVAERVRQAPGIVRGKDYHFHSKKLLLSTQMKPTFPREIYSETIGGVSFDIMTLEMSFAGQKIMQKQYAAILKGYALLIIASFTNDEEEAEVTDIIRSIEFSQN